jgi:phospholipid/cholesterol/gamma-HCH transport system ATP-binding protein
MINVKDLWKSYNGRPVLQGMNLEIKDGEILVILGRSGSGKSVLLRHILGLEKPDAGHIEVNGLDISSLPPKGLYEAIKDMGMLFQGGALFDSMNVEENTSFYLNEHKDPKTGKPFTKDEIHTRVMEALKMVELEEAYKKMPAELSGGMKKRAALARLIVYRPSILLYDEPTTGLDPITTRHINELIIKTQNELKGTSIVVTHDIGSALFVADRIALLQNEKIAYIAEPEAFLQIDDPTIKFLKEILDYHPQVRKEQKSV